MTRLQRRSRDGGAPIAAAVVAPAPTTTPPDQSVEVAGGRLGEVLVRQRAALASQIGEALLQQSASGQRLGDLLLGLGVVTEDQLAAALAEQFGCSVADLPEATFEPEALALIPETLARALNVVPLSRDGGRMIVAAADASEQLVAQLRAESGLDVVVEIAPASTIRRIVDQHYRALAHVADHVSAFEVAEALRRVGSVEVATADQDAPVVQVVNLMMTQALRDRASDVHVEPQEDRLRIRFRIDGVLHDVLALPAAMGPALVNRIKILSRMNIVERRRAQDGQFALTLDGRDLDVRVSTAGTIWGEKAVLRLLDKSRPLFRLSDLGMPAETADRYAHHVRSPFGMVVCVGPTGAGKTTTLYATLGEVNRPELNVVTIEDPVEYVLPSINQIQINEAAEVTFAGTLRATMRQDPDVILVGEVRDAETARIAVRSALTGHLVLTSLHATDAASAVHRLLDMGVEPFLVSSSLVAVVAQRLVRRVCPHCAEPYKPTPAELAFYRQLGGPARPNYLRGRGCTLCARSGYLERIGVYEVLSVTDEVKELVVSGASRDQLRDLAVAQGMKTLRQEGLRLVASGVTTIDEVARNIYVL